MNTNRYFPLWIAAAAALTPALSHAGKLDDERERWVVHSRAGEAQRLEAVEALHRLYRQSGDKLVRADLTALLIRGGQRAEALAVCPQCGSSEFSADELENLAKAARDIKKFDTAATLYQALQTRFPQQKIGFLGGALVAADQGKTDAAAAQIRKYRKRFGNDGDIQAAENYLNSRNRTPVGQLAALNSQLDAQADKDTVLQTYRLAAQMQAYPVQERLLQQFPQYFTRADHLWAAKNKAASRLRGALATYDQAQLKLAYQELTDLMNAAEEGSDLYISALRDRLAASTAVGKPEEAIRDYRRLAESGEQPDFVKQSYAQALSLAGSPNEAFRHYQPLAANETAKYGRIGDELNESLIGAYADLAYFDKARAQIPNWHLGIHRLDFTQTVEIKNPYYDKQYFWDARLDAWNGNIDRAIRKMDAWIADHPADPWAQILRGELAFWNGHPKESLQWYARAQEFLPPDSQDWVKNRIAIMQTVTGNWREVDNIVRTTPRDNLQFTTFYRDYDEARAPLLSINANAMKATSPSEKTEWGQTATLYSKRSEKGHRAYITEQTGYVPNQGSPLRSGRVGIGAEISAYPATVTVEAGHGVDLNKKAYAKAGVNYSLGSRLNLTAEAARNSANIPAKALSQGVYADEYALGAVYTHSDNLRIGAGGGVMDFDDGNTRKSANLWLSGNLYRHNRWQLSGSLSAGYSKNKDIPSAYYYNPRNSRSANGVLAVSYNRPFDGYTTLRQTLSTGFGRYWQADVDARNTWLVKYGHDWQIGRKVKLNYEIGRREAIYDGKPEFQNFGSLGLNVKLK